MNRLHVFSALFLVLILPAFSQVADTAEATKSLAKGDKAPLGKLVGTDGKATTLATLSKTKPLAVVFYRGKWCPLCMRHLKEFDLAAAEIEKAGYQLIAVTPDGPEDVKATQKKFSFRLYSDPEGKLSEGFGIAFKDRRNRVLPTPAVYAIARDGTIEFAHADANYRKRIKPATLLEALK